MRTHPRRDLAALPGELIAMGRRFASTQTWVSGSIINLGIDTIDFDPYNLIGSGVSPLQGRHLYLCMLRVQIPTAGGSVRYSRVNQSGVAVAHARWDFTAIEQTACIVGGFNNQGRGGSQGIEFYQDSGVSASILEAELAVFYGGET